MAVVEFADGPPFVSESVTFANELTPLTCWLWIKLYIMEDAKARSNSSKTNDPLLASSVCVRTGSNETTKPLKKSPTPKIDKKEFF